MPRKVGWTDESITAGFGGADKERRFRGKRGETAVIRVLSEAVEYRVHVVDDVLEPDSDTGEQRAFNMNCARTWDDDAEDWVGDCLGCDRDYDFNTKYIAGILVVGIYKGRSKTPQKIDPEHSVHFWDFGADKYRKLSDLAIDLSRAENPKTLSQVELVVKCEDEHYQKLNINISQGKPLTTKEHVKAFREEGQKLVDEASAGPSLQDQKRRLKKRKKRDDDGGSGGGSGGGGKKRRRASKPRDEDPPEEEEEEDSTGDDDLDDLLSDL